MIAGLATVAAAITGVTGRPFRPVHCEAVGGGSIHAAYCIGDGTSRYFLKRGAADDAAMFAAEAESLATLGHAAVLSAPTFVVRGSDAGGAFLILEYLDLAPLDAVTGDRLGAALARLHRVTAERFGWNRDNYIGRSPQPNGWQDAWPRFFASRRLLPQLQMARLKGMESRLVALGESVAENIAALFLDYHPLPSLLHGDLWSGNTAQSAGEPVIFDPACYYGDRETDLAMAELFGGFPDSFYVAYRKAWPLAPGYETRKTLYNLYHVLNHYNLFGAGYLGQARRMIESLRENLRRS